MNIKNFNKKCLEITQRAHVAIKNPNKSMEMYFYLFLGITLINLGVVELATAASSTTFTIEDTQFRGIICAITRFIEGAFGALIMIIAGIGAIVSAAFGQYKAALGLLAVAIGAFVLRSLVNTFFGAGILQQCQALSGGTTGGTAGGGAN